MRAIGRMAAYDVAAPVLSTAAFVVIGVALAWPKWWVAACALLCSVIAESTALNFYLMRRHGVLLGSDAHGTGARLAVAGLTAASLAAAALICYTQWWVPQRAAENDVADVVRMASSVCEATATFSPQDPMSSIDRAAMMMPADRVEAFKTLYGPMARDLASKNQVGRATVVAAGVEVISPKAASVAVIIRATQAAPGSPPGQSVQALRVALVNDDGHWVVWEVSPIRRAPTTDQTNGSDGS